LVHLDIHPGEVEATVSGSSLYKVKIRIAAAAKAKWSRLCTECSGGIGSLVELLQGRFSDHVMGILTRKETGLFPAPSEINLECSCPDWATMCKHVAAVLYGVGARLDQSPELLFTLRSVNHEELITQAATGGDLAGKTGASGPELAESELAAVFGIELDISNPGASEPAAAAPPVPAPRKSRSRTGKTQHNARSSRPVPAKKPGRPPKKGMPTGRKGSRRASRPPVKGG
jgi:uncharacterized Zn finger protein